MIREAILLHDVFVGEPNLRLFPVGAPRVAYGVLWVWPMAYDAPCGGSGRSAPPAVPWLAR
eukprot:4066211-Prymnesium_polylepis.1